MSLHRIKKNCHAQLFNDLSFLIDPVRNTLAQKYDGAKILNMSCCSPSGDSYRASTSSDPVLTFSA